MRSLLPFVIGLSIWAVACSSTSAPADASGPSAGGPGEQGGAGGEASGGTAGAAGGAAGSAGGIDVGPGTGKPVEAEVYSHSADTLYKLDPQTKQVTKVGVFDCVSPDGSGGGMWDIALDKDNVMWGTSNHSLVQIDRATAKCKVINEGTYPNSLTFVPAGVLDPTEEVLVGYDVSSYVRIDKATGKKTEIGGLNPNSTGQDWESSGDIVSIIGDKTYLTAKTGFGGGADTLIEVDPKTGKALKVLGKVLLEQVWGLGYWGGRIYGFSAGGQLVDLDLVSGKGQIVSGLPSGLSFWGAGVTTAAPTGPIN